MYVKTTFFWNGIQCSTTDRYQYFRETYCLHVQGTPKLQATSSSKTMVPPHQTPEYHSVKHTALLTWVKITNIKITACYWYYKTPLHKVNILYSRAQNTMVTQLSAHYMSKLGQRFITGYSCLVRSSTCCSGLKLLPASWNYKQQIAPSEVFQK